MTLPPLTLAGLNKRKSLLVNKPTATAYDWIRLGDEYALLDASRQVDFCLMQAERCKVDESNREREDEQERGNHGNR